MIVIRSLLFNVWFFSMTAGLSLYGLLLRVIAASNSADWALRLGQLGRASVLAELV